MHADEIICNSNYQTAITKQKRSSLSDHTRPEKRRWDN